MTGHTVDPAGNTVGMYHDNPMMNTLVYDVKFPDGEVKEYLANVIAENLFSQVDDKGFALHVFDSIYLTTQRVMKLLIRRIYM